MRWSKPSLSLLATVAWISAVPMAYAATPNATGSIVRDFARVTFEWPQPVFHTVSAQGNVVSIRFEREAHPDLGGVIKNLGDYISKASMSKDGKTLTLTMKAKYRVRSFSSGKVSGIDILDIHTAPKTAEKPKEEPQKIAEPAKPVKEKQEKTAAPVAKEKEKVKEAAPLPAKKSVDAKVAKLSPAAGVEAAEPAAPAPEVKTPEKEPAVPPEGHAESPVEELTDAQAMARLNQQKEKNKAAEKAELESASKAVGDANVAASGFSMQEKPQAEAAAKPALLESVTEADVAAASAPKSNKVLAVREEGNIELHFPWKERVAVAAFLRGPHVWIVFNKPSAFDFTEASGVLGSIQGNVGQVPVTGATVIRLPAGSQAGLSVAQGDEPFEWVVKMLPNRELPTQRVKVDVNAEPPVKPHLFLGVSEASEPLIIKDPDRGDEMIVLPVYKGGEGVTPTRSFVEFKLLESPQGVVVQKINDDTQVTMVRNGARVSTPNGASLTPGLPPVGIENLPVTDQEKISTLFPYQTWKATDPKEFLKEVRALAAEIAKNPRALSALDARVRLAQMYLADGMAAETLGWLAQIRKEDPSYYVAKRLSAMAGAANFMLYRFNEAGFDFSVPELNDLPEVSYWRNMMAELLGTPEQSYDYTASNAAYIRHYPPALKQRLAVVAADKAISSKQYNVALGIFDDLNKQNQAAGIADYINFLMGKISVETGQAKDGLEAWNKLLESHHSEFVQARARFAIITQQMKSGELTEDQAVDKLEKLQLTWRGDSLELSVLAILGDIYEKRKSWADAMRVWNDMNIAFPNTALATEASRKMVGAFVSIFDKNENGGMPLLQQLALYNEYRDLTPTDEVGDRIISGLADKMIGLDMLDQAATLLEQRMRFRFEREERSRIGAKLARVQLMNNKPDKALQALQESVYGNNTPELSHERDLLVAESLIGLSRYDEALRLVAEEKSDTANDVRLRIHWLKKDWPQVVANIEETLKNRSDPSAPVTMEESEKLVQLAIAYVMEKDGTQLQYLRDYFTPLMEGNKNQAVFNYVTEPDLPVTAETFDAVVKSIDTTKQFFKSYNPRT